MTRTARSIVRASVVDRGAAAHHDRRQHAPQRRPQRAHAENGLEVAGGEEGEAGHRERREGVRGDRLAERPLAEELDVEHRVRPALPQYEESADAQTGDQAEDRDGLDAVQREFLDPVHGRKHGTE